METEKKGRLGKMTEQRKIVVLDAYTLCADELNYDELNELGSVTVY